MFKKVPQLHADRAQLILLLLVLTTISALMVSLTINIVSTNATDQLDTELTRVSAQRAEQLGKEISSIHKDVFFMSRVPSAVILTQLSSGDRDYRVWKSRMQDFLKAYMGTHEDLLQARLIGVTNGGREIVRINRNGAVLEVVPEERLQFKNDTDYFKATLKLSSGQTYISSFDLNREYGKVQFPLVPVVRSTAPLFDSNGKLLVVVN